MVLPTSTYAEIFDAVALENEKIEYYWRKNGKKASKELAEQFDQNLMVTFEYHVCPQSRNKYLLWYATTPERYARDRLDLTGGNLLVVESFNDRDFFFTDGPADFRWLLHITSHFVKRYRERFLKDDSTTTEKVIATYLYRNGSDFLDLDPDETNVQERREENTYTNLVKDGIIYIELNKYLYKKESSDNEGVVVLRYKTFVSRFQLNEKQTNHVKEKVKELKDEYLRQLLNIPKKE